MRHPWDIAEYPLGGSTRSSHARDIRRREHNHQRHKQYQRYALPEAQRIALIERPGLVNRAGCAEQARFRPGRHVGARTAWGAAIQNVRI